MTREIEEKASNYVRGRAIALSFKPLSLQDVKEAYLCGAEDYAHISEPVNPWHKASEELPPVNTEVVCKMKGVPYIEHFICKWDGEYWLHWGYFGQKAQGWFGLNICWEVVEWKEI